MDWLKPMDPHVTSNIAVAAVQVLPGEIQSDIHLPQGLSKSTVDTVYQFLALKPFLN